MSDPNVPGPSIETLVDVVSRIRGRRIAVLGDWMLDRYVYGDAERVSPEAPVPVLRAVSREERCGGAGSVAVALAALGASVHCAGAVGDDPAGARLIDLLAEAGCDVSGMVRVPRRPTTTKTRLVGLAQHRHRQQLLRLDEEDTTPLDGPALDQVLAWLERHARTLHAICVQDHRKGVVSERLIESAGGCARQARIPLVVDPAPGRDFAAYRGATVLTPNRNEFQQALGRRLETIDEFGAAALAVAESLRLDALAVTLDREGAVLARPGGGFMHVPTRPRAVYDNTGAGDAVLAAMTAALAAGADHLAAVRLANVAGGLEVEKFGCVPIPADEIIADLRLRSGARAGKLRRLDELLAEIRLRRDRGSTIVFTNGCFDLLHPGHVDFLSRCKQFGDVLIVGLNSDRSVRRLGKGDDRPICNEQERAAMLSALADVDYVVLFDEPDPENLIRAIRPDVLVKGQDWADRGVVGQQFVESIGGRVELLPLLEGYSTTGLIERIRRPTVHA